MGLAIDGNTVHGLAVGGQAFLPKESDNFVASTPYDFTVGYNGQDAFLYIDIDTQINFPGISRKTFRDLDGKKIMIFLDMVSTDGKYLTNLMVSEPVTFKLGGFPTNFKWISNDDSTNARVVGPTSVFNGSSTLSNKAFAIGGNAITSYEKGNFSGSNNSVTIVVDKKQME